MNPIRSCEQNWTDSAATRAEPVSELVVEWCIYLSAVGAMKRESLSVRKAVMGWVKQRVMMVWWMLHADEVDGAGWLEKERERRGEVENQALA